MVNVYIKDPSVTQVVRDQKVPVIWFVANIGGILGLTMGMSVVTIFEILHHVAMLFVRTGAKSLGIVRRTIIIPNKSTTEIDGLGNGSKIKAKKSLEDSLLEEHLDSVNNQRRQQSSINQGFIKQSFFI